jgi:hypothetical protein
MLHNYFRYDGTISRDYYRAIAALERMQASRHREEDRQDRKLRAVAKDLERIQNDPNPDTIARVACEPPLPHACVLTHRGLAVARAPQLDVITSLDSIGFVSRYSVGDRERRE